MSRSDGRKIMERFVCKVICADCSNNICDIEHMSLWFDKPYEIVCFSAVLYIIPVMMYNRIEVTTSLQDKRNANKPKYRMKISYCERITKNYQ